MSNEINKIIRSHILIRWYVGYLTQLLRMGFYSLMICCWSIEFVYHVILSLCKLKWVPFFIWVFNWNFIYQMVFSFANDRNFTTTRLFVTFLIFAKLNITFSILEDHNIWMICPWLRLIWTNIHYFFDWWRENNVYWYFRLALFFKCKGQYSCCSRTKKIQK